MLWYKSWLETRWRFIIGIALLSCSACGVVLLWPKMLRLMDSLPANANLGFGGDIGRSIQKALALARDYQGYIWSQWFRKNMSEMATLFAVLLGTGGLLSHRSGGLFTLSLPVSRNRLLATRAIAGLAELWALVFLPALLIPLLSPAVGKTYPAADAAIYGLCTFLTSSVFFSLALLLSTIFDDFWPPLTIALLIAVVLAIVEPALRDVGMPGIFRVMNAEDYFRNHELPWRGLIASIAAAAAMLYGATIHTARRDF